MQAGKEDGAKDKEELRRELLEMAILQAESELAVNPAFAGLSAAEKEKGCFRPSAAMPMPWRLKCSRLSFWPIFKRKMPNF